MPTATPAPTRRQSCGNLKAAISFEFESTQQQHAMVMAENEISNVYFASAINNVLSQDPKVSKEKSYHK